jgi:hypothetical protein
MFVIVQHEISNPKTFWETAQASASALPSHVRIHQTLPNHEGTKAVCLWEATGVEEVKGLVEGSVGKVSKNTYFAVETANAMGLPVSKSVGVPA